MRILHSSLFAAFLFTLPTAAFARDVSPPVFDESPFAVETPTTQGRSRLQRRPTSLLPASVTARLIQERALSQARQRRARIEMRKWAGVSLLRPDVPLSSVVPGLRETIPAGWTGSWAPAAPQYHFVWQDR